MAIITCDICDGQLTMDSSGEFALCEICGMKHSKERIKAKLSGILTTMSPQTHETSKVQVSNYEKIANDAFKNHNYSEAYNYYCKVLEENVNHWFATFRKNLCIGWQASISQLHAHEVIGGIEDATNLIYNDNSKSDVEKANCTLTMASDLADWIFSLNNHTVNYCNKYCNESLNAVDHFYDAEHTIYSLIKFNISMITEFTYCNCENADILSSLTNSLPRIADATIRQMQFTFKVKTGTKYNAFLLIHEDVIENAVPPWNTRYLAKDLNDAIFKFKNNIHAWKIKKEKIIRIANQKKIDEYWANHVHEKNELDLKLLTINSELESIEKQREIYDLKISELRKELSIPTPEDQQLTEVRSQLSDLLNKKSQLGMFSSVRKKLIQDQIDSLQRQINDLLETIQKKYKTYRDSMHDEINRVIAERKPFDDRINELNAEKRQINTELNKVQ